MIALIAAVGNDQLQPWESAANAVADPGKAVRVLDVERVSDQDERQAERVGEQMALAAEGLLAALLARIPPNSVAFTL